MFFFLKFKTSFAIVLFFFLVSCAGTGSKIKPSISQQSDNYSNLYFVRQGGYVAGGILAKIDVNGMEIAKLGTKEYISFKTSKNFKIKVSGAGISGLGMGSDSTSGVSNGKNYFYIIGVKQGLFSAKFTINETTESGYNQAL
tara:strand:+ start:1047 stop:1472 length:426 start_codon:yes stop_codon:yes gene_type:complete